MQRIAIDARRDMVQLTILLLTNPMAYTVVHSELFHVSMLIAFLTDLVSSNSFGCSVDIKVSVCSCVVNIKG